MDKTEQTKWINPWVVCNLTHAHLFFTSYNKKDVVVSVLSPLIEAAPIYRLSGPMERYIMLYKRSYRRPRQFALVDQSDHLAFRPGEAVWTNEASPGELLRDRVDERLEVDSDHLRFLIQGMRAERRRGEYVNLPWRLGLITTDAVPK